MTGAMEALLQAHLGRLAFGARREAAILTASLRPGEEVRAAAHTGQGWVAWVAFVTTQRLVLVRAPRVLGRTRREEVELTDLRAVRVEGAYVVLSTRGRDLRLKGVVPAAGQVAVLDELRAALGSSGAQSAAELRDLARRKLGGTLAFGFQDALMAIHQELEDDEAVQRLAVASPELVVALTPTRVLLGRASVRESSVRSLARVGLQVEASQDGLTLVLPDGERLVLGGVTPPGRVEELGAALGARPAPPPD